MASRRLPSTLLRSSAARRPLSSLPLHSRPAATAGAGAASPSPPPSSPRPPSLKTATFQYGPVPEGYSAVLILTTPPADRLTITEVAAIILKYYPQLSDHFRDAGIHPALASTAGPSGSSATPAAATPSPPTLLATPALAAFGPTPAATVPSSTGPVLPATPAPACAEAFHEGGLSTRNNNLRWTEEEDRILSKHCALNGVKNWEPVMKKLKRSKASVICRWYRNLMLKRTEGGGRNLED